MCEGACMSRVRGRGRGSAGKEEEGSRGSQMRLVFGYLRPSQK